MSGVHNHAVNLIRVAKDAVAQQQVVSTQHHSRPFVFYKSVERVNLDVRSLAVYLIPVPRTSGSMSMMSGGTSDIKANVTVHSYVAHGRTH